ncbi:hypothetical protein POM88_031236 [Heracleum sosnowskyi]|uniref:F-box domain-containing protein n=1 Tax=Heracleum sosnowskyi TaxID=360622 RepID=A0AAD8HZ38_9APIA|nr:hypothetical protein POM88_031236 [Heracleum sosnowskyi]
MDFNMEKPSKKSDYKLQEENQRNGMDSLPHEIALDIFSRLPITSVMQSRFVCRSWHKLSLDSDLVSLHLSQVEKRNPLLIFHSDFPIRNQLCFAEFSRPDFSSVADGHSYHLANLKGCLSAVVYKYGTKELEIWVMKEYNVKESWIKEFKIGANIPESPSTKLLQPLRIWRNSSHRALVRVLCILESGEILIEYRVGRLALYDVVTGRYKDITYKGLPSIFQTVVHIGSLNQIDLPIPRLRMNLNQNKLRKRNANREKIIEVMGLIDSLMTSSLTYSQRKLNMYLAVFKDEALFTNGRLHWTPLGVPPHVSGLIIISFDLASSTSPRHDFNVIDGNNYYLAILEDVFLQ